MLKCSEDAADEMLDLYISAEMEGLSLQVNKNKKLNKNTEKLLTSC